MPIRNTTHILKNSDIVNRPLPSSLLKGEAIVNTADGIVYFSGVTTSTSEWTPAGTGTTANFFEVGSNLYDLRLRNRITEYEGVSGSGLIGKFLSGTTNGFVLADISSISGVDSYVTGGTYNPTTDAITLTLSEGKPNVVITGIEDNFTTGATLIGSLAYFDRTDSLSAYTLDLSTFVSSGDTYVTGFTYDGANNITITQTDGGPTLSVNINTMTGLTVNGVLSATTIDGNNILSGGTNLSTIISNSEIYVTGGTVTIPATDNTNLGTIGLLYKGLGTGNTLPFEDTYTTGGTLNGNNLELDRNDGTTLTVDLSALVDTDTTVTAFTYNNNTFTITDSANNSFDATINSVTGLTVNGLLSATTIDGNDILSGGTNLSTIFSTTDYYTTGFTYNPSTNTFQIGVNDGNNYPATINSVSGLTVSNLTAGRVVYVGTSGLLTDEAGFTYDATTNTLSVPADGTVNVGTGGLNVDGDAVIQGSLTVFGPGISAFTSDLYVEDNNIFLNYNPTGSTVATSIGSGWSIQDGNGVTGGTVNLNIKRMDTLTGLTASNVPDITEYSGPTGYANRGWVTQLNDIVIRSTNITTPNGVRVLAEFDILDGGSY